VGMAVATTVDSIDAKNRLNMMPAVTRKMRLRDIQSFQGQLIKSGCNGTGQSYPKRKETGEECQSHSCQFTLLLIGGQTIQVNRESLTMDKSKMPIFWPEHC
jgi:hypothetical protein